MVKLFKWVNTDSAYILLLQYAGGGKLLNYVKSYQCKQITNAQLDFEASHVSPEDTCDIPPNIPEAPTEVNNGKTIIGKLCRI